MTALILAILIAFSAGGRSEVCKLGEPLSTRVTDYDATRDGWVQWVEQNGDTKVIASVKTDDLSVWMFSGKDYAVMFVFNPDNMPHGQCAKVFSQ